MLILNSNVANNSADQHFIQLQQWLPKRQSFELQLFHVAFCPSLVIALITCFLRMLIICFCLLAGFLLCDMIAVFLFVIGSDRLPYQKLAKMVILPESGLSTLYAQALSCSGLMLTLVLFP